ncbi:hypothetical protein BVY01_02595 [bacterium I07]|nr:hypothetical protein BVY01_02595 [bacterium I07]
MKTICWVLLVTFFLYTGCSTTHMIARDRIDELKTKLKINVYSQADTYTGKFIKLEEISDDVYTALYNEKRNRLSKELLLPSINDTLTFITVDGEKAEAKFLGFDYQGVRFISAEGNRSSQIPINRLDYYEKILDVKGRVINRDLMRQMFEDGELLTLPPKTGRTDLRNYLIFVYFIYILKIWMIYTRYYAIV